MGGAGEARGLAGLEGSYLSLDGEGRVVRLDSFAKALAPGLRLGWATGAPAIIDKLASCIHGSALGPCATTQAPPPPPSLPRSRTLNHVNHLAPDIFRNCS